VSVTATANRVSRLLIIDDELSLREMLTLLFEDEGHRVETADSVAEGRRKSAEGTYDLILCDLMMPDGSGLEVLREVRQADPAATVIMMTAFTSTKSAIEAMKLGAHDYIPKPFDIEELKVLVQRALEKKELVAENVYLRRELEQRYGFGNVIGRGPRMQAIFSLIERVARTQSTVLVQGESGTGKELIARAIHFAGPRTQKKFLSINCGALPEGLLESELFGHERGAFTGAVREKRGLFQEASGGTLFLDEIGEMTPSMQVKLLRALQDRSVRKVGGTVEEQIDVRIIAATNQNLEERIAGGHFREDLFYRINVIPIHLPALRQRREDIQPLVEFFLVKYARDLAAPAKRISLEALRRLEAYDWPGNVRELENVLERALALSMGPHIGVEDLPPQLLGRRIADSSVALPTQGIDLEHHLEDLRAELMRQALERSGANQTAAAQLLRMSFRSFRYYAKKLGLVGQDETEPEPL
jgi:two-component system response regulator PilR (NtrC family)